MRQLIDQKYIIQRYFNKKRSLTKPVANSLIPSISIPQRSVNKPIEYLFYQQKSDDIKFIEDFKRQDNFKVIEKRLNHYLVQQHELCELNRYFELPDIINGKLYFISVVYKTENDSSILSPEMHTERKYLAMKFKKSALEFKSFLSIIKNWTDFIDPYTEHAYFSKSETLQKMKEIDMIDLKSDLSICSDGCCPYVTHREWGSNVFTASLICLLNFPIERISSTLRQYF